MTNKHQGSDFDGYLLAGLRESDEMVFLHIKEAFDSPDLRKPNDCQYLVKAIADVAKARGKSLLAAKSGITRQALHKILTGVSSPNVQSLMAMLSALGLRLSVEKIERKRRHRD